MSKREAKRERKRLASCEHRSDMRSAEFVVRQVRCVQDDLGDLLAEFRAFGHFSEMEDVTWCLMVLERARKKYAAFAENGVWPEEK
jgi:hypothetical protein